MFRRMQSTKNSSFKYPLRHAFLWSRNIPHHWTQSIIFLWKHHRHRLLFHPSRGSDVIGSSNFVRRDADDVIEGNGGNNFPPGNNFFAGRGRQKQEEQKFQGVPSGQKSHLLRGHSEATGDPAVDQVSWSRYSSCLGNCRTINRTNTVACNEK